MVLIICLVSALAIMLSAEPSAAEFKNLFEADYALERDDYVTEIKKDGSSVTRSTRRWIPFNEAGRQELAQSKIYFTPGQRTVEVTSARTLSPQKGMMILPGMKMTGPDGKEIKPSDEGRSTHKVNVKTVVEKEIGLTKNGIISTKAKIIPFTNLELRSSAEYSTLEKAKPLFPGQFTQTYVYGSDFPEISGKVVLRSEVPLTHKVSDPRKYLKVESGRDGALYTLSIEILRPIYFVPKDEHSPVIEAALYPRVDVTTAASWQEVVQPVAPRYEKAVAAKLPEEFQSIARSAASLKTDSEKFNHLMRELTAKITYAGDWSTSDGMFFPRGHDVVAKTKTGDCKDYSTTLAAMLRSLGYDANVALTFRGDASDEFRRDFAQVNAVPALTYFNHAIVHVKMRDGSDRWLDPTNLATHADIYFSDIANSPAIVLHSGSTLLKRIPPPTEVASYNDMTVNLRPDGVAEIKGKFRITGEGASQLRSAARQGGNRAIETYFTALAIGEFKPLAEPKFSYNVREEPWRDLEVGYEFTSSSNQVINEGKTRVLAPYPYRYKALALWSPKRHTNLFLGSLGTTQSRIRFTGLKGPDDVSSDCVVLSPWFDIDRKVVKQDNSVVVSDTIRQRANQISTDDHNNEELHSFLGNAHECLSKPIVFLQSDRPAEKILKHGQINLEKAVELILTSGNSTQYGRLTAHRVFERLIEKEPENLEARAHRGYNTFILGYRSGDDYDSAYLQAGLHDMNYVLAKNPNHVDALHYRSRIYYFQSKTEEALADFTKVRALAPNDFRPARTGADIALRKGQVDIAEKWLIYGHAVAPSAKEKSKFISHLAGLYLDTYQNEKAIEAYKKILAEEPQDSWTWNNISIAYNRMNSHDLAVEAAKKALSIQSFGAARSNLARALCAKAEKLYLAAPSTTQLSAGAKGIEDLLFEGIKSFPSQLECLQIAGLYYERRAFELKEQESAARSSEYFARIYKEEPGRVVYSSASSNMNTVAKEIAAGRDPNVMKIQKPSEMFRIVPHASQIGLVPSTQTIRVPSSENLAPAPKGVSTQAPPAPKQ